jgi:hypothetical protein
MKSWLKLAAKLYPRTWRERYATELETLLDDAEPRCVDFLDMVTGAFAMQIRSAMFYVKFAAAVGAAGLLIAIAASFMAPARYIAATTLRTPDARKSAEVEERVLSRANLYRIINQFGLYLGERHRVPTEDLIDAMRKKDIQIDVSESGEGRAFRIAFEYPDRDKADTVARELVKGFVEGQASLEALPASIRVAAPGRSLFAAWGLGIGLCVGLAAALLKRRPRWTLKAAAYGVAGLILAFAGSLLIPDRYISSAVLSFDPPNDPADPRRPGFRTLEEELLSNDVLSEIIQRPAITLYPDQRHTVDLEIVLKRMREKDLSIQRVDSRTVKWAGPAPVYRIAFAYPDRQKAQTVVQALIMVALAKERFATERRLMAPQPWRDKFPGPVEVIDSASFPELSVFPNRGLIAAIGLTLGLLAGAYFGRVKVSTAPPDGMVTYWRPSTS